MLRVHSILKSVTTVDTFPSLILFLYKSISNIRSRERAKWYPHKSKKLLTESKSRILIKHLVAFRELAKELPATDTNDEVEDDTLLLL